MPETVDIALGRRKRSIARVRFIKGKGNILINDREVSEYFKRPSLVMELKEPLSIVEFDNKNDILVNVNGGGLSGQAGAVRHGLSRALSLFEPDLRKPLKSAGMLTRDSRVVERKKYGRAKARKSFQFSKR